MTRFIVPLVLVVLVYGYWKYIAFATGEERKKRVQTALSWGVFVVLLAAAARSGSATWLLGAAVVMVAMRLMAKVGLNRQGSSTGGPGAQSNPEAGSASKPRHKQKMSRSEALQIFELGDNPPVEAIQKRYRELMRGVHPDRGGSNYLAAQLNEAYQVLMAGQGH
jgi:hypothetical protein